MKHKHLQQYQADCIIQPSLLQDMGIDIANLVKYGSKNIFV